MADALAAILRRIDTLDEGDLLRLHREVSRRAAKVYNRVYASVQEHNYRAAMTHRATEGAPSAR